jgi:hypothetical protein
LNPLLEKRGYRKDALRPALGRIPYNLLRYDSATLATRSWPCHPLKRISRLWV